MNYEETKYFIYCRKSSEESTQRQIASIGDQIDLLNKMVRNEGLKIVGIPFTEEKSAKDPGRPIFNKMLDAIEKGEANGVICYDIDRLYRNPVDEGRLRWLLQKGIILSIKTPYRSFFPEDAGLLMGVEGGRATDYVIRLSRNVKRGLNGKAMRGWRPNGGPIGYLNVGIEKGSKTIDIDPDRFHLVRKMWDLYLTGSYSVSKVLEIATTELGLRTLKRRKIGGRPLTMSHMYRIFNDSFYYGYFPWTDFSTGERTMVKGSHTPMITETEFWRAQALLGKKGIQRPKQHEFAFTGCMTCGGCGSSITAEEKLQVICSECKYKFSYRNRDTCPKCDTHRENMKNPTYLKYIYYHCTRKKDKNCKEKTVTVEKLEEQFKDVLKGITIDRDYLQLALEYLQDKQKNSGSEEKAIRSSLQEEYDSCQTRINNLHKEYTSPQNTNHELYTAEEFRDLKKTLLDERKKIEDQMNKSKAKLDQSLEMTERVFNFCAFACKNFNTDDLKVKRAIFSSIGSNLTIKGQKLTIEKFHPYLLIENELKVQKSLISPIKPKKDVVDKRQSATFMALHPNWLHE